MGGILPPMTASDRSAGGGRRDAWRGKGGGHRPSSPSVVNPRWRGRHPSADDVEYVSRQRRLAAWRFGLSAAALALVVLLVALLLGMKRQVPLIAGVVWSYRTPLGPLPLAEEDRRLVNGLSRAGTLDPGTARVIDISTSLQDADADQFAAACCRPLPGLRPGGPRGDMLIVHLTAIGGVDRDGRACLVMPKANADIATADEHWLRVDALLARLTAARPANTALLVVLDACRSAHAETLGVLDGTFAAAVAVDVKAANHDRLWVLTSAGPGETACASAVDGASLFAAAFADGIEGSADAAPSGDDDGRVELAELAAYLRDEVDRRALVHHGRHQRPLMVPSPTEANAEVAVAWAVRKTPTARSIASATLASAMSVWLTDRWAAAESLRDRCVHEQPLAWSGYESLLLRAERLAAAGAAAEAELKETRTAVEVTERLLRQPLVAGGNTLPGVRLARLAGGAAPTADPAWLVKLEDWSRSVSTPGGETGDGAAPPPCLDAGQWRCRAAAAWERFVSLTKAGAPIDRSGWQRWNDLLGPPPAGVGLVPGEVQAARLLASGIDESAWSSAPTLMGRVAALADEAALAMLPDDVRADAIVEAVTPTRDADAARRTAFDLTVVGDDIALAGAAKAAQAAGDQYGQAANLGALASDAWRLLDQVRAEWPWLALWTAADTAASLERPPTGGLATPGAAVDWKNLATAVARLETALTASVEQRGGQATVAMIREAFREADGLFSIIRGNYDDACDTLAERAAGNATTLAAIRAALATPLVAGERRMRLLERAGLLAAELHAQPVPTARDQVAAADAPPIGAAGAWVAWSGGAHPFVAALGLADEHASRPPASAADLAVAAGRQGLVIRTAAAQLRTVSRETTAAGETTIADRTANASTARRLAPLGPAFAGEGLALEAEASPITLQLGHAWHVRLIRVASTILDDFFGGAGPDDPPWFAPAAAACLEQGAAFGSGAAFDRVSGRLEMLRLAPQEWAVLETTPDRIGAAGDGGSTAVRSTLVVDDRIAAAFTPGDAALWLTDGVSDEPLSLVGVATTGPAASRLVVPAARPGTDGRPQSIEWRVDRAAAARVAAREGSTMPLTVWFRGHPILRDLPVGGGGGAQPVVWRRPSPLPPRVTVRGIPQRRGSVSFIFDCSGSMGADAPNGRRRFDVGRESLYDVLQAMAKAGTWDASLWLYGHRTRWIKRAGGGYEPGLSDAGERERAAATQAGRPFTLEPGMDVQRVLPMQPMGPAQAREVIQLLSQLRPAGETPLYLALRSALMDDMPAIAGEAAWRVVVVTDGVNDQTGVQPLTMARDVRETLAAVNRGRSSPVHVDVIAFDIRGGGQAKRELESLARESGGQFVEAADPSALLTALRSFLSLARWEVRDDARVVAAAELGSAIELPIVNDSAAVSYRVSIEGREGAAATVSVNGSEALELFVAANGRGLEHRRYDGGTEQGLRDRQAGLADPLDQRTRWFVGAHLPRREGTAVRFPISVQNDDESLFTPRPVAWWAEVIPEGVPGSRPFVVYDAEFQPRRPVPVIDLTVPDWPREASQAAIRVWFSMQPQETAATIAVDGLSEGVQQRFTFPELAGIGVDAVFERRGSDQGRITVVERHPREAAAGLPRLVVKCEPLCDRASHTVDAAAAEVRHEFDIRLDSGGIPKGTRVTFVAAERLKEQAVGPLAPAGALQPLRVTIPTD